MMIAMMTLMVMARVQYQICESDGDDYYSGKLEEACLNCVVDAVVIKDANHILNIIFFIFQPFYIC